jgi:transposase InsO family protein
MCDPATGWFEVAEIWNKTPEGTAKILDQTWFFRYPRPKRCISDNGNEFLGKEFQELLLSYGVKSVATTFKNPQANFVERVHQTLGSMLRSHELEDRDFDYQDQLSQILANCA